MVGAQKTAAQVVRYELEIEIDAPRERVWKAITEEPTFGGYLIFIWSVKIRW